MARQYPKVLKGEDTGRLDREEVRRVIIAVRDARLAAAKAAKRDARKASAAVQPARVKARKPSVSE
jgi:hypothetical protein